MKPQTQNPNQPNSVAATAALSFAHSVLRAIHCKHAAVAAKASSVLRGNHDGLASPSHMNTSKSWLNNSIWPHRNTEPTWADISSWVGKKKTWFPQVKTNSELLMNCTAKKAFVWATGWMASYSIFTKITHSFSSFHVQIFAFSMRGHLLEQRWWIQCTRNWRTLSKKREELVCDALLDRHAPTSGDSQSKCTPFNPVFLPVRLIDEVGACTECALTAIV